MFLNRSEESGASAERHLTLVYLELRARAAPAFAAALTEFLAEAKEAEA